LILVLGQTASGARLAAKQTLDQALEALQQASPAQKAAAIQHTAAARAALSEQQIRAEAPLQCKAIWKQ
jgi:hypothetical protein